MSNTCPICGGDTELAPWRAALLHLRPVCFTWLSGQLDIFWPVYSQSRRTDGRMRAALFAIVSLLVMSSPLLYTLTRWGQRRDALCNWPIQHAPDMMAGPSDEVLALMASPAYMDASHAQHAAVSAKVAQAFAALQPAGGAEVRSECGAARLRLRWCGNVFASEM